MDRSAKFWDRIADRYSKRPVADEAAYQEKLRVTREYFRPDMEVLEFGCGTGSTAIAHAPFVKHIRAIDISSRMIEIAQAKAAAENTTNVTFERSTIEELDAASGSVDAVLALNVLHLLENREASIAKVYEMLRTGGVFVSSTACIGDMMKLFKLVIPIGRILGLMPLVTVFTVKELEDSLVEAGFHIEYQRQPDKSKAVFIVARKPG